MVEKISRELMLSVPALQGITFTKDRLQLPKQPVLNARDAGKMVQDGARGWTSPTCRFIDVQDKPQHISRVCTSCTRGDHVHGETARGGACTGERIK